MSEPDRVLAERHRLALRYTEAAKDQLDLLLRQLWVRSADTEMLEAARIDLDNALERLRAGYEAEPTPPVEDGFEGCLCACHRTGGDRYFGQRRHNVCCK